MFEKYVILGIFHLFIVYKAKKVDSNYKKSTICGIIHVRSVNHVGCVSFFAEKFLTISFANSNSSASLCMNYLLLVVNGF